MCTCYDSDNLHLIYKCDQPLILSACSLDRKALGECVCQKVMQSAHHAETAQTSSVLWWVSVWGCLNGVGWRVGGCLHREAKLRENLHSSLSTVESFQFLRSPPLHACYIVKPEPAAGLYLTPHSLLDTLIVQHYEGWVSAFNLLIWFFFSVSDWL